MKGDSPSEREKIERSDLLVASSKLSLAHTHPAGAQFETVKSSFGLLQSEETAVFVVMTNNLDRQKLADALAKQGCHVFIGADGEIALQMIHRRQPNLLILEVGVPGKDSFELCAQLRTDVLLRHIPVLLIAHELNVEQKMRGFSLGAVGYLTKPFSWTEIAAQAMSQLKLEKVRRVLAGANLDLRRKQDEHGSELRAAAEIQKSLLPPHISESFEGIKTSWTFLPLDHVGGDLLGYKWLDENHMAAYVADVCGHGLAAAMMTAAISSSLTSPTQTNDQEESHEGDTAFSPNRVLKQLDRDYPLERFERPFTIAYLVLHRKTGEFRCSRAGHPMPLIIRKGGRIEPLEAGGSIIGLGQLLPFDESSGRLNPGDSILLYSDGITECSNGSSSFGIEGLSRALSQCSGASPERVCERIMANLFEFKGHAVLQDDVAMLVLTYEEVFESHDEELRITSAVGQEYLSSGDK
jgi:sigma-B regulation protein RsbU (phosphoserine phosphatase)